MAKSLYDKTIDKLIEMGATEAPKGTTGYTHVIDTYIGKLYLLVSITKDSRTLYGNFLDNPIEAREELGTHKHNLHTGRAGDFITAVQAHINWIK
jgi:hypothetical protein